MDKLRDILTRRTLVAAVAALACLALACAFALAKLPAPAASAAPEPASSSPTATVLVPVKQTTQGCNCSFSYRLVPEDASASDAPMPKGCSTSSDGSRVYAFSLSGTQDHQLSITSSSPGNWTYTLSIVKPSGSHHSFDVESYRIGTRFYYDESGALQGQVSAASTGTGSTYKATGAHFTIKALDVDEDLSGVGDPSVTKIVDSTGRDSDGNAVEPASAGKFQFTLSPYRDEDRASYPMPPGSSGGAKTLTVTGAGHEEFGNIAFDRTGVYDYKVTEVKGSEAGYTYDETVYRIRYTVTEGDGALDVVRDMYRVDASGDRLVEGAGDDATFTNRYAAPGTTNGDGGSSAADTGDSNDFALPIAALFGASAVLVAAGAARRKRRSA